jgi:hypothetical protein
MPWRPSIRRSISPMCRRSGGLRLIPSPVVPNTTSRSIAATRRRVRRCGPHGMRRPQSHENALWGFAGWYHGPADVAEGPAPLPVVDRGPDLDPAEPSELTEPYRRGSKRGSAGLGFAMIAEAASRLKANSRQPAWRRVCDLLTHLPRLGWLMMTYRRRTR